MVTIKLMNSHSANRLLNLFLHGSSSFHSVNSHNLIAYATGKVFGGSRCMISAKFAVQISLDAKIAISG